ncbi:hypothetical protein EW146_g2209 [Bondarzewia mesenterica]|uniref:Uncharacterized protein n=1 Tax=Bondarzewia mesenterica TaxID=1095465 RepID=A0A4S4M1K7_9AGAM|nr:hypothetical protein EW146_g2209 [Bondarzewia mesenterica]
MPKRAENPFLDSSSPPTPAKRPYLVTPLKPKSTPRASSSVLSTPYTPYTPYSVSIPSDSPTNPFGFKHRSQKLTLPKSTSFSKHLALRFQIVKSPELPVFRQPPPRPKFGPQRIQDDQVLPYDEQGIYRIVQVPLSYNFRHLHKLILFMFNGDPNPKSASRSPTKPGYLFEAQDKVIMCDQLEKPGQIEKSRTWAKLSRAQDPYYSAQSIMDLVETAEQADALKDAFDVEGDDWRWEGEEDFTIGHVWTTRGGDLDHAIIYVSLAALFLYSSLISSQHHDAKTTIHITTNTQPITTRKGVGNKPFVFRAFGEIHLDPSYVPPKPKLIFPSVAKSKPAASLLGKSTSPNKAGDTGASEEEEDQDQEEDFDGGLDTRCWNRPDSFERFIALAAEAPARQDSPPSSTPGLDETDPDSSFSSTYSSSPLRLPVITPAPALALTRFRVDRVQRRMKKLVEKGIKDAEEEEAKERAEEVDELDEDGEGEEVTEVKKTNYKGKDWDPFGDEAEI